MLVGLLPGIGLQLQTLLAGGDKRNWILVGSPRGETGQKNTKDTGIVFRCPVSSDPGDCAYLDVEDLVQANYRPPHTTESKDNQWLGVSVSSQGPGQFAVVCAHRYLMVKPDYRYGTGACYILTKELDYNLMYSPCRGLPTTEGHQQYAYCQFGTDACIAEDGTALFGAPGSYTWTGSAMVNSVQDPNNLYADGTWYNSPVDEITAPVGAYSYLGYSVTTGNFINDEMTYVAGAPRSKDIGEVVFFHKVNSGANKTLIQVLSIKGEELASYFGHSLAAADLNDDGLPDLVIGAPFYRGPENKIGGVIYIYKNSKNGFDANQVPVKISGPVNARFGYTVRNIGDVNQDGYVDIAVGAPYEGNGAVYLFHGSMNFIVEKPAQIIRSENLPGGPFASFGHSLAGGQDLDENGYPDIVVGAYESDKVLLLLARPVVNLAFTTRKPLNPLDPYNSYCLDSPGQLCISFEPCFKYTAYPDKFDTRLRLNYTINADIAKSDFVKRVYFKGAGEPSWSVTREIILKRQSDNAKACGNTETVYVKKDARDILNPILFEIKNMLVETPPTIPSPGQPLPSINDFPILQQGTETGNFKVDFLKDCGDDGDEETCRSDLVVKGKLGLPGGDQEQVLVLGEQQTVNVTILVTNLAEAAYETMVAVTFPDFIDYSYDKSSGSYACAPENETFVCEIGNPFKKNGIAELRFYLDTRNIPATAKLLTINAVAKTSSEEITPENNNVTVETRIIIRTDVLIEGSAYPPDQILYGGEVKGAYAMNHENDIGSYIEHSYTILNNGTGRIDKMQVFVSWPYEVENNKEHGKYLLYMITQPEISQPGSCSVDKKYVNSLNLELSEAHTISKTGHADIVSVEGSSTGDAAKKVMSEEHARRRKREAASLRDNSAAGIRGKVVTLDCKEHTAKCFTFVCNITDLSYRESAKIKIRARLWNSTFLEDYRDVDYVQIISRANVTIDSSLNVEQDTSNDFTLVVTKAFPDALRVEIEKQLPIWIIIVSVAAGILVLSCIIAILCWAGFFKRQRPEVMTATMEKKRLYGDETK